MVLARRYVTKYYIPSKGMQLQPKTFKFAFCLTPGLTFAAYAYTHIIMKLPQGYGIRSPPDNYKNLKDSPN